MFKRRKMLAGIGRLFHGDRGLAFHDESIEILRHQTPKQPRTMVRTTRVSISSISSKMASARS